MSRALVGPALRDAKRSLLLAEARLYATHIRAGTDDRGIELRRAAIEYDAAERLCEEREAES